MKILDNDSIEVYSQVDHQVKQHVWNQVATQVIYHVDILVYYYVCLRNRRQVFDRVYPQIDANIIQLQ